MSHSVHLKEWSIHYCLREVIKIVPASYHHEDPHDVTQGMHGANKRLTATAVRDKYSNVITVMTRIAVESCRVAFVSSVNCRFCCRAIFRFFELSSRSRRPVMAAHLLTKTSKCRVMATTRFRCDAKHLRSCFEYCSPLSSVMGSFVFES